MKQINIFLFFFLLIVVTNTTNAQTIVSNQTELNAALNSASAGDEIILKNGVWKDVLINIGVNANSGSPLVLRAETTGSVFIEGNSNLYMGGSFVKVEGLIFRNASNLVVDGGDITPLIQFRDRSKNNCNNCTLTNIKIDAYNGTESQSTATFKWIYLLGENNEISYSSFIGKHGIGSIINDNRGDAKPNYNKIHHNYFAERTAVGDVNALNDQDAIRIGTSTTSLSDSYTEVYSNYFNNWAGEIEIISNKSGKNKYYNNTFRDYHGSLTLRHGNNCEVYDNFFFANNNHTSAGIRVIGEGHLIYNNYIEGVNSRKENGSLSGATGGINITNGLPDSPLNGYYQVKNAKIVNNTFVNCDYAIRLGTTVKDNLTLVPYNVVISNNIMLNSSSKAFEIETAATGSSIIEGNISQNGSWDLTTGDNSNVMSSEGLLIEGELFYILTESSIAIEAGLGDFSFITKDIKGSDRGVKFDAGAEEFGGNGSNQPFVDSNVGKTVGFGANVDGGVPTDISTSVDKLEFYGDAGSDVFSVLSNTSWTITSELTWVSFTPTEGINNKEITVKVEKNYTAAERRGIIKISEIDGDSVAELEVIQSGENSDGINEPLIENIIVTGVGTQDPNIPENTLDRDHGTRWSGESNDGSAYLTYNLGEAYEVSTFRIMLFKGSERTSSFKLLASEDGEVFTEATGLYTSTGETSDFEKIVFSPALSNMQYIRIAGYGNSGDTDWNSYTEVEIYGILSSSVGLEDINLLEKGVSIFPNPVFEDEINIKSESIFIESFKVLDISGRVILEGGLNAKESTIDVSSLEKGSYILMLPNIGSTKFLKN